MDRTDARGAVRIAAFGLVSYFEADGLRNDFVPFLFEDDAGRVIAASASPSPSTNSTVVASWRPGSTSAAACRIRSTLPCFAITWARGGSERRRACFDFRPSRDRGRCGVQPDAHYARLPGLPSDELSPLFEDRRGDIWLIVQLPDHARLVRWRRATDDFQTYGASEGLAEIPSDGRSRVPRSSRGRW